MKMGGYSREKKIWREGDERDMGMKWRNLQYQAG
jgi:hypothetical protein